MKLQAPFYARALCAHRGTSSKVIPSLSLVPGDLIRVTSLSDTNDIHWHGVKVSNALIPIGTPGRFLFSYVEVVPVMPGMHVVASTSFPPHPDVAQEQEETEFSPKLRFEEGDIIFVHSLGVAEDGVTGVMMEGEVIDPETEEPVGAPRGWFPSSTTFMPFEATAILDSWWGPQSYSDFFFNEGQRFLVEHVDADVDVDLDGHGASHRGPRWKGRRLDAESGCPVGESGFFPSELVVVSSLLESGNGLTASRRLSGGSTPRGRPGFPYRVTSKRNHGTEDAKDLAGEGTLVFSAQRHIAVTGRVSLEMFRGRLLCDETLEPVGEQGLFRCDAVLDDPW